MLSPRMHVTNAIMQLGKREIWTDVDHKKVTPHLASVALPVQRWLMISAPRCIIRCPACTFRDLMNCANLVETSLIRAWSVFASVNVTVQRILPSRVVDSNVSVAYETMRVRISSA